MLELAIVLALIALTCGVCLLAYGLDIAFGTIGNMWRKG